MIEENESIFSYIDENPDTYYEVTAYPDYSSKGSFVTSISTTDPNIELFGVNITNDMDDNVSIIVFENIESNTVTKIIIDVTITNKYHIVF